MKFLTDNILFPRRYGVYPYFALLFLGYPLAIGLKAGGWHQLVTPLLLLAFILFYRHSFEPSHWLPWAIGGQLLICYYFAAVEHYLPIFVYTAALVGTVPLAKTSRWRYFTAYYGATFLAIATILIEPIWWQENTDHLGLGTGMTTVILMAFILGPPLAALSVSHSLDHSHQLQQTNDRLITVIQQHERERIAQDLHDTLGQSFSMITVKTDLARKLLTFAPDRVDAQLADVERASRNNLQLVRDIVNNLRQPTIAETLLQQSDNLAAAGITLLTKNERLSQQWSRPAQLVVGAIIQEAITNMIRHAHANHCWLIFSETDTTTQVLIRDNGNGFKNRRENSSGISGMKQRIAQLPGGQLTIETSPQGTTLTVTFNRNQEEGAV
ncbi:sensor histidine kinase [Furfurilactobacillus entadae]|uniref:sensor histidine kinase n=1 Tax=Furfurilactobacillus entadae TaxID=2922307 RepID=UPI0035EF9878